jgi:hypothetical protein
MDFLMDFHLQNVKDKKKKIQIIIQLLTKELPESTSGLDYNIKLLHEIVLAECSKVYLTKEVEVINKSEVFKPYKDLCAKIALVISSYDQKYPFPKSLSSTLIESAHQQQYFVAFLPRLTDVNKKNNKDFTSRFLENLVFSSLNKS